MVKNDLSKFYVRKAHNTWGDFWVIADSENYNAVIGPNYLHVDGTVTKWYDSEVWTHAYMSEQIAKKTLEKYRAKKEEHFTYEYIKTHPGVYQPNALACEIINIDNIIYWRCKDYFQLAADIWSDQCYNYRKLPQEAKLSVTLKEKL